MRLMTAGAVLFAAAILAVTAAAQTLPAAPITRSVIAETKLHIAATVPLYFRAVGMVIPANETSTMIVPRLVV